MSDSQQWVFSFGDSLPKGVAEPRSLLGGKGASLAEMSRAGLHVPPGFTISTKCCRYFFEHDETWPPGLEDQVRENLARLETATGRSFGQGAQPLLVSVRSGAAISMPGMMDTILNCGIHPGLADAVGDTPLFWRPFVQFVEMFACTAANVEPSAFAHRSESDASREMAAEFLEIYEQKTGRPFPLEPWEQLVECINAVFRSWNNERAIAYRQRNCIHGLLGTAVNVQAMFPSRVSGILFTQDPGNLAPDQMVIESSYGLGEAVVSGDVTPDRFRVSRDSLEIMETEIGNKSHAVAALGEEGDYDVEATSLTPEQVVELCRLGLRVESHFGRPMDIEWGWADGRFALLQCRPIRGLEVAREVEVARREEIARLSALAGDKSRIWVAHNLSETLRFPTPLTWDIVRRFMSGSGGFGRMYRDFGYRPSREVCDRGFLDLIGGRIYADPDRMAQLFWDAMPLAYDRAAILRDKRQLDRAPTRFDPEKIEADFIIKAPGLVRAMLRNSRTLKRAAATAKEHFDNTVVPAFLEYVAAKRRQDLSDLSTTDLLGELRERRTRVLEEFGKESLKPAFFGGMAFNELEAMLVQLMGKDLGTQLANTLTMGLDGDITFEQNAWLGRVAAGELSMDDFLERFGHRAAGEMELAEPRWREEPAYLYQVIRRIQSSGDRTMTRLHMESARRREAAEAELPLTLAKWGGSSFGEEIRANLRDAQALLPYREIGKHYLMMGYEILRLVLVELSRRWELGGDLFFLRLDELEQFESRHSELRAEIRPRKIRWQAFQRLNMPDVIDSSDLEDLGLAPELEAASEFTGDPIASGVATGPARLVFDPSSAGDLGVDYILVCPSTDPGWTPLFLNARGLIVERGGVLSHGAIVARDFGIPAAVCPNATKLIRAGDTVRLDGNSGRISIIKNDEAD